MITNKGKTLKLLTRISFTCRNGRSLNYDPSVDRELFRSYTTYLVWYLLLADDYRSSIINLLIFISLISELCSPKMII